MSSAFEGATAPRSLRGAGYCSRQPATGAAKQLFTAVESDYRAGSMPFAAAGRNTDEINGPTMTIGAGFPDQKVIAELTAKMLLEVEAVRFMTDKPFIFTSGWASPVYTDCRRLISFPRVRETLIDFGVATVLREIGFDAFDAVAGGETAGIPFAAWMADRLGLPMQYVRKKPKGFGRNAQIEGHLTEGQRVLLVEDMTTDGRSKVNFCKALRDAGAKVDHVFVLFFYDIFPEGDAILSDLGVTLHKLATWWDVLPVAKASKKFDPTTLTEVEKFLHDPVTWSKAHGGIATAAE
jgi:orotate phosphoribosyltransferase